MPPKKLTSQRAIEDALDRADIDTRVLVTFKCITDVEWLIDDQGTDIISDMDGNALKPATLAAIVSGVAREYTVAAKDEATLLTHEASDESLWVIPAVIKSLAVLPSPKTITLQDSTGAPSAELEWSPRYVPDWHTTLEAAQDRVQAMKSAKLKSLRKQVAKLEATCVSSLPIDDRTALAATPEGEE